MKKKWENKGEKQKKENKRLTLVIIRKEHEKIRKNRDK